MKIRVGQLKRAIREEYLRGVPEFILRQATTRYVDEIRQHIKRYIVMNKSRDPDQQREAIAAANAVLEDLEEKSNDLLDDQLWTFIKQV